MRLLCVSQCRRYVQQREPVRVLPCGLYVITPHGSESRIATLGDAAALLYGVHAAFLPWRGRGNAPYQVRLAGGVVVLKAIH